MASSSNSLSSQLSVLTMDCVAMIIITALACGPRADPKAGRQQLSGGLGLLTPGVSPPQAHTMYQVGLMETDQHIEFFWGALETFTQEELCRFIKFACNQERIPFTCPCKDGGPDTAHVPPYPMKIAPPDGTAGTGPPTPSPSRDTQALLFGTGAARPGPCVRHSSEKS